MRSTARVKTVDRPRALVTHLNGGVERRGPGYRSEEENNCMPRPVQHKIGMTLRTVTATTTTVSPSSVMVSITRHRLALTGNPAKVVDTHVHIYERISRKDVLHDAQKQPGSG